MIESTPEQLAVVSSNAKRLVVEARAGAGKTSTLVEFARARSGKRHLYLAFNKSVEREAAARFPTNVVCRTTHSVAYRKAVELFGRGAAARIGNTWPSVVARRLGVTPLVGVAAMQTLQAWVCLR